MPELPLVARVRQSECVSCLRRLLDEHVTARFPSTVDKREDYERVEPVEIDSAIVGWASGVAGGVRLSHDDRTRLTAARDDLSASLDAFPTEACPYFERLVDIAEAALRDRA